MSKMIPVPDLNGHMTEAPEEKFVLRIGVYGILKENGKILVQKSPLIEKYSLPGGGVEFAESFEEALKREYLEETGLKIEPVKLLAASRNYVTHSGEYYRTNLLVYEVKRIGGDITQREDFEDSVETQFLTKEELVGGLLHEPFRPFIEYL